MLYMCDVKVEYPASMSQRDLFTIWAQEADAALGAKQAGLIVGLWKCVGERRVIVILDVESPDVLDQITLDLPIMVALGHHVHIDVTALRPYENFAADLKQRALDTSRGKE
jgi:muconolactone delta-isomerase